MTWCLDVLVHYSELAVCLVIALGALIGGVRFREGSLGLVSGALVAGLAHGQTARIPTFDLAKSFLFPLFFFGLAHPLCPRKNRMGRPLDRCRVLRRSHNLMKDQV